MSTVHKLLTPEEIASKGGAKIPFLHLPERADAFASRARRLRSLAPGHALEGYLEFMALVADQQQVRLDNMPPVAIPRPEALDRSHEHGMPPIDFSTHARDVGWCDSLRRMLRAIAAETEGTTHDVVARLENSPDALYEAQASKLLAGITFGLDIATAPLIGAGLQVYFTHLALALGQDAIRPIEVPSVCPCCGSRPTASIARVGSEAIGFRFLHCSLCSTEWHMVRVKCTHCESTKGISYLSLDDGKSEARKSPVLAETCDECNHYLKICHMDRDLHVDPCADDLATLALDLLVTEDGREPWGVNYMLVHGDPDAPPSQPLLEKELR
ncbi:Protein FdhE [Usitatibacter rugosus]|uniref:Protein FdhE homolog n=1 Tax=Usitatibacter rugosus TaxID=2732067 RepID=A0A6M4GQ37_9PROT|nr:formate dehydrogenase accessory protein FdhE [Usitatibacter rugosus]QJR09282.1 Protein FdhE [Usitatibacter rugosus]